jgi:hypothetical protein
MRGIGAISVTMLLAGGALAGEADVVAVEVSRSGSLYRFDVTVRHGDTGWDHYADGWDVVAPDGSVLGTRTLLHPHENEQPFTRSLSGVAVPAEITEVTVRAHDSVDGYGGAEMSVALRE